MIGTSTIQMYNCWCVGVDACIMLMGAAGWEGVVISHMIETKGLTPLEQKALKYVLKHEAVSISNLM